MLYDSDLSLSDLDPDIDIYDLCDITPEME